MGFLDGRSFQPPSTSAGPIPSLQNFMEYKDTERQKQMQFEKEMARFQSQQRLKELGDTMRVNRIAKAQEPLNVLPPTGLITPLAQEGFDVARDRANMAAQNNMQRNMIAQQNADTKRDLGYETLDTRRDIAGNTLASRENIAGQNNETRLEGIDRNIAGRESLEGVRQTNRATNLNTRGNQMLNNIAASGAQSRLTKSTPSPNVNSNNPSQQLIAEKTRANQFMNQNPNLAKHVSFDPNTGMVVVAPPTDSRWGSGPTQDEYHQIIAGIYGSGSNVNSNVTAPAPPASQQFNNVGKVRVQLPDGRIGMMPEAKAKADSRIKILGGGQ